MLSSDSYHSYSNKMKALVDVAVDADDDAAGCAVGLVLAADDAA